MGVAGQWRRPGGKTHPHLKACAGASLQPGKGFPALPAKIRRLLTDKKIRKRAALVGVLYQPEEWRQANPDPALIVEWKALPGQYFALAVWGPDYHRIMEFVD